MPEITPETLETLTAFVVAYGMKVIGGVILLTIGWLIAGWLAGLVRRTLRASKRVDRTIVSFVGSLVRYAVLTFVIVAVLGQFGIQTASIIAVVGALGLAIGLALQGTLSHVASGFMLLVFRPIRVGDYIEAGGHAGTVEEITLFTTELATPDNVQIILPNGAVWGNAIKNYSFHARRRVDFTLGIAYGDSIDTAMEIVQRIVATDDRILQDPPHQVVVGALNDSSVDIIVRVWTDAGNYWPLKFDLTKRFKEGFDAGGITIPFPQTELHLASDAARALRGVA